MRRERAFTIIELLAVLGIIAVLVAFLIPSIARTRERARQIQCSNNLKQIALSLQNYMNTYESLPPGAMNPLSEIVDRPQGDPLSWTIQILPYLEQSMLAGSLNDTYGPHHFVNRTVIDSHVNTLMCPAASFNLEHSVRNQSPGRSAYAGCHHDVEAPIGKNDHGVLYLESSVRAAQVGDGMSQTFFLGEIPLPGEAGWASGTRATLRNTGHPLEQIIQEGKAEVPSTFVGGFGSRHLGGATFSFGDGSVRFVHVTVDPEVLRRLGNRDDGEIIDDEASY